MTRIKKRSSSTAVQGSDFHWETAPPMATISAKVMEKFLNQVRGHFYGIKEIWYR